jgi:pimeloyl-ACP methyl ester carboxylesterase
VLAGWKAHSVHVLKVGGLFKRYSPGRVSAKRRWQWPSADAALAHFQAKHAFARWAPEVLRDYIAAGTEPDPEGADAQAVRLAFHRDVETRIYNSLPHNMGRALSAHPLKCPVTYLAGTQSSEGRRVGLAATKALAQGRVQWIEGSHLFPMERPAETAQAVLDALAVHRAMRP